MTDKIMIDGVDVKDCRRRIGKSDDNYNYVWKQLLLKTAECEKLKEENEKLKKKLNDIACCDEHNTVCFYRRQDQEKRDKYRQALDTIEKITNTISNYLQIGCDMDKCEDCNHFKPYCTNQCVCYLIEQGKSILSVIKRKRAECEGLTAKMPQALQTATTLPKK